jgi:predicted XRE-type DNA-binding protein
MVVKTIEFRGSSLDDLRSFPSSVMREAGYELDRIQNGLAPDDFKPMPSVGKSVTELRLWDASGTFRVIYLAKFEDTKDPQERHRAGCQAIQRTVEGDHIMKSQRFTSVWDAIEDTPQAVASMKARSSLMMELTRLIETQEITQAEAAELFGVTQPRVSDLMRGKINLFSLDMLINMAATAGMAPVVKLTKPRGLPVKRALRARSGAVPA